MVAGFPCTAVTISAGAIFTTLRPGPCGLGLSCAKAQAENRRNTLARKIFIGLSVLLVHRGLKLLLSLYRVALAQGFFEVVHEIATAAQAEFAGGYLAVAVHKKCCGQNADAAVAIGNGIFANQDGIIDAHFFGELCDLFIAGIVHGYADDLESLGTVFFLELDKPGHLDFAGSAVSCPEIEKNGLAAKIGELEALAVEGLKIEIGGQVADELSLAGRVGAVLPSHANSSK